MNKLREIYENYFDEKVVDRIFHTEQQCINLEQKKSETTLFSSKIGGYGYLPKFLDYPTNEEGQPLSLLAQINFSEMPIIKDFPKEGILSFYVDYFDDLLGLDFDERTEQNGFKVFYFPKIDTKFYKIEEIKNLFSSYENEEMYSVVENEMLLIGYESENIVISDSVDFTKLMKESYYDFYENIISEDEFDNFENEIIKYKYIGGTKIGGYPFFTQSDPREDEDVHDTLLFQLDSSDDNIFWGDYGVGNFFINRNKLKNKDFSDVLYNWDCY